MALVSGGAMTILEKRSIILSRLVQEATAFLSSGIFTSSMQDLFFIKRTLALPHMESVGQVFGGLGAHKGPRC